MADIVLTTLNAKFAHASLGLRCLQANLGALQTSSQLLEFDLDCRPIDIVEHILSFEPRIVGVGVYIWNVTLASALLSLLKQLRPDIVLVAGGPECADLALSPDVARHADYVIVGEAEHAFAELCQQVLGGTPPPNKVLNPPPPSPTQLQLPYPLYSDDDLRHRTIYIESSRGCPFQCEFCLSANDVPLRLFAIDRIIRHLEVLLKRGARQFKFVDRSLNITPSHYSRLLEFFLEQGLSDLLVHIEVVPDRLTEDQMALASRFPKGVLQMEAGIQTLDSRVAERIKRHQNLERLEANLKFLRHHTGVHLHTDLIVGLPGESWMTFADGFDRLAAWQPHEIQVGILKLLPGTAIHHHNLEWEMVFDRSPPYEILQNRLLSFVQLQRLKRFARFWDLVANRGRFNLTCRQLWYPESSPFNQFMSFSDWLYQRLGRHRNISVSSLAENLFVFLTEKMHRSPSEMAALIHQDLACAGFSGLPPLIKNHLPPDRVSRKAASIVKSRARQQRHHQAHE